MTRRTAIIAALAVLVLPLVTSAAIACGPHGACTVERTCTAIENGVRCTIKATGETTAEMVRACARSSAATEKEAHGLELTFEDVDGGVVVTRTTADADMVKALHEMAQDASGATTGCGLGGHHGHGHAKAGCAKKDCPADCKKPCCAKKDCKHAKAEAGKDCPADCKKPCCAKKDCKHAEAGCSKDCDKTNCPHAKAEAKKGCPADCKKPCCAKT